MTFEGQGDLFGASFGVVVEVQVRLNGGDCIMKTI
jgi:hypothetical protein